MCLLFEFFEKLEAMQFNLRGVRETYVAKKSPPFIRRKVLNCVETNYTTLRLSYFFQINADNRYICFCSRTLLMDKFEYMNSEQDNSFKAGKSNTLKPVQTRLRKTRRGRNYR